MFNFLLVPFWSETPTKFRAFPKAIAFGVIPAEIALLAIWQVFGSQSFPRRCLLQLGALLLLGASWYAGYWLTYGTDGFPVDSMEFIRLLSGAAMPVSLATQVPLWPLRTHLGWRIEGKCSVASSEGRSLSIGDILGGTVITAIAISTIRFSATDSSPVDWPRWGMGLASVAGISLLSTPVGLILLLRPRLDSMAGALLSFVYAGVAGCATILVMVVQNEGRPVGSEAVIVTMLVIFSYTAILVATLLLFRAYGYRLRWAARER
ncbi:MAG: hypothetical protein SFU86_25630 [Pirellulaceae bacterium]|nr:hypothetical protein [Pirellulaceae bacterium]